MFRKDFTFRTKVMGIIITTCGISLLVACGIFFAFETTSYRSHLASELSSLSNVLGANTAAALVFEDDEAANAALSTLAMEKNVIECTIFDRHNNIFANYRRYDTITKKPARGPENVNRENHLTVANPIIWKGEPVGKIRISSDMRALYERLRQYTLITAIVLAVSLMAAFILALQLHRVVSAPVSKLIEIARHISSSKDYSIRVPDTGRTDELGELLRVFNRMIEHIHERDTALQKAHDSMEHRVQERTGELRAEINERQKAEDTIRTEKERARQYLDIMGGILVALDAGGRITLINRKGCSILGREEYEIMGMDWFEIAIPETIRGEIRSTFARIMSGNIDTVEYYENPVINKAGTERLIAWNNTIIKNPSGKPIGTLSSGTDITERRQAEESLRETNARLGEALEQLKHAQEQVIRSERLKALGEMASGIAHDFNNALMPMLGFTSVMINDPTILSDREETLGMIKDINMAARDAAEVVRRLREFYKPAISTNKTVMSLNHVIETAVTMTRPKWKDEMSAKSAPVEIKLDLKDDLPVVINESQIREVMINLIINATDAMPKGGTITMRTLEDGRWIVAEIGDTGTGMDAHVLKRCFDPFFTTKGGRGTGLGLSIVHGIVRQHDGWIDISSSLDKGTTVKILLPRASSEIIRENTAAALSRPPAVGLHVLIIDDEAINLKLLSKFLQLNGFTIQTAKDGKEGLALFRADKFDLVITDRSMPYMSGDEVAAQIRVINPKVPIIMLTGYAEIMEASNDTPSGISLVLRKPITKESLNLAIANAMSKN